MDKNNEIIFFFQKGNLEIMKSLDSTGPMQFKELRELKNPATGKKFSSATVAQRLKELEEKKYITNEVIKNKNRKRLGYTLTPKGKNTLGILKETEEKLEKIK